MIAPQSDTPTGKRVAYLFSRFPVRSQTFTDNEMLGLENRGWDIVVGSIHAPQESFRQPNLANLRAPVIYNPPRQVMMAMEKEARANGWWPEEMVNRHEKAYGPSFKSATRARNALYFAKEFQRLGVTHVHVPFANRALHTALFLKEITGLPLSFTTHGQDFMVDLDNDDLLAEMCATAAFVVAVCDYSRDLLRSLCPASAERIQRIYNGLDPAAFPFDLLPTRTGPLRLLSIGRLIEFKGFHRLIEAVGIAVRHGADVELDIVGEGPWRDQLAALIDSENLAQRVRLCGPLPTDIVREKLYACDAFALACLVDSKGASDLLPTVITEAMLCGRAVLSTTVAGVPEMVDEHYTGRLVAPDDARAMARAIQEIDRPSLRDWGEAGRKKAEGHFIRDVTLPALEECFEKASGSGAPTSTSSRPAPPQMAAFYDLSLQGRRQWLRGEWAALKASNALVIAEGGGMTVPGPVQSILFECGWMPDGMVLEAAWQKNEAWRLMLEKLRTELSTLIEGEQFFRSARRAVGLAERLSHPDFAQIRLLYAPGVEESLAIWMTSLLLKLPCALAFDDLGHWNGNLLRQMAQAALLVSDASGKSGKSNDKLRHSLSPRKKRLAFIRWKVPPPRVTAKERSSLLKTWLENRSVSE